MKKNLDLLLPILMALAVTAVVSFWSGYRWAHQREAWQTQLWRDLYNRHFQAEHPERVAP